MSTDKSLLIFCLFLLHFCQCFNYTVLIDYDDLDKHWYPVVDSYNPDEVFVETNGPVVLCGCFKKSLEPEEIFRYSPSAGDSFPILVWLLISHEENDFFLNITIEQNPGHITLSINDVVTEFKHNFTFAVPIDFNTENGLLSYNDKILNEQFKSVYVPTENGPCVPFKAKIFSAAKGFMFGNVLFPTFPYDDSFMLPTEPPTTSTEPTTTFIPEEHDKTENFKWWIVYAACGIIGSVFVVAVVSAIICLIIRCRKKQIEKSKNTKTIGFVRKFGRRRLANTGTVHVPISKQRPSKKSKHKSGLTSSNLTSENFSTLSIVQSPIEKPVKQNYATVKKEKKTKNTETLNAVEDGGLQIASDSSKNVKQSTVASVVALPGTIDEEEAQTTQVFETN